MKRLPGYGKEKIMILVNNREQIEWTEGMTVQDVLTEMGYSYVLITVMVNEKFIPSSEYQTTKLEDEAQVHVFHLAHGG
jgi:thiamine biosynthesis protein ThiS